MGKIWLTSDLHLGHNRAFVYGPRGFESCHEHDIKVIENLEHTVSEEDDLYILGDLMLGDNNVGIGYLKNLKCKIHIVRGNHDTDSRWEIYKTLPNVVEMENVIKLKYNKYHFYLSHYPTMTANFEKESLKQVEINLYGHIHQKDNFYEDRPYMYHVGLDSQNNCPVLLDDIIEECEAKVKECLEYL